MKRVASVTAGLLALTGIILALSCLFTGVWDGRWVLSFWFILTFVVVTAWTERPVTT